MSIKRFSNWMNTTAGKLFYWQHLPTDKVKNCVVIIIGPIGPEYMHCFRSIRLLADTVAQSGFHCIRYDPIGMGNSSGCLEDENIWNKWIESPKEIYKNLSKQFGFSNTILIGLRSGNLILSECINDMPVSASVFWYPYTRGTAFIRDIELLDSILYGEDAYKLNSTLNGGGYPVTNELKSSISNINITNKKFINLPKALIIASKETSNKSKLHEKLIEQSIDCNIEYLEGLDAMTKQVAISKIPYNNINSIENWLNQLKISVNNNIHNISPCNTTNINDTYVESIINIDSTRPLFGVLTTPKIDQNDNIVIIVNTGSAHHVGPNRFHVDAARHFAINNISTLCIDISNLGESTNNHKQDSNHPYPPTASEDINYAVKFAQSDLKYKKITLCGLCSGAHNIFHAALESDCDKLQKLILINPLTFYWKPGQTIFNPSENKTSIDESYYQKQLYDFNKWIKLITNPRKIINIIFFISRLVYTKSNRLIKMILAIIGIVSTTKLEQDFMLLANKGISILLIHSDNDPGYRIVTSQASRTIKKLASKNLFSNISISDADHTFSSRSSRLELIKSLLKYPL